MLFFFVFLSFFQKSVKNIFDLFKLYMIIHVNVDHYYTLIAYIFIYNLQRSINFLYF